jgi:hypothetical protein
MEKNKNQMVFNITTQKEEPITNCIGLIKNVNKEGELEIVYASKSADIIKQLPNSFYNLRLICEGSTSFRSLNAAAIKKLNLNPEVKYTILQQKTIDALGLAYNGANLIVFGDGNRSNNLDFLSKPIQKTLKEKEYLIGKYSPSNVNFEKNKYSFGVEIETSGSSIRAHDLLLNNANVSSLRDGSVAGHEFVTPVLVGDAGLQQLNNVMNIINKTSQIDKTCGIHVHIGGANFNKDFTVLAFILGLKLEEEFLSVVPNSRKNNEYCGKFSDFDFDYDYPLKAIKEHGYEMGIALSYEFLYRKMIYNDRADLSDYDPMQTHPNGRYCGKYNGIDNFRNFRYKWLNLIPTVFNMKNGRNNAEVSERATIEFRHHSATLNFNKVKNWIFLCSAFVRYVENNRKDIIEKDNITLKDLLSEAYPKKGSYLNNYFEQRKTLFNTTDVAVENAEYVTDQKVKKVKAQPEAQAVVRGGRGIYGQLYGDPVYRPLAPDDLNRIGELYNMGNDVQVVPVPAPEEVPGIRFEYFEDEENF